ncbi:AAA family ATPase [Thalassobacillus sp. CUG 92003]|uniref:AAA family ATPase n=1 Tax=Thalassobacillus sp. CUG 92003 TaxID=2736641 RepID=UPI0015E7B712|nr:AAA family ATPase [Thalassobacillus sp. CUG 92003]
MNKKPNRIHIIGSVGSGKTTLAKALSETFTIPFFEIDNIVWKRYPSGDIRRTEQERDDYLQEIIQSERWIIEGVHNEAWVADSFRKADLIIFLDPTYSIRTYRIIKRFVWQKLGLEQANYKPTLRIFFKMFKWNKYFEEVGKPNFYKEFGAYQDKVCVATKKRCIKKHFE